MTNIAEFLNGLSASWKALTALAGAVAFGFVIAVLLGGWTDIPEVVEANTAVIDEHVNKEYPRLYELVQRNDSIIIREIDNTNSEIKRTNCVLVALGDGATFSAAVRECGL